MQLLNDFFEVLHTAPVESGFIASIQLRPGHLVYAGHFPGFPVTPGVIQIQIVHELLERQLGRKLKLKTMSQCKFLNILNPVETPQLTIHIEFTEQEGGLINVKARGERSPLVFFRLNACYQY
jgi:3-hydroxyacyl-[acyl-carrier-protein] dehydratase